MECRPSGVSREIRREKEIRKLVVHVVDKIINQFNSLSFSLSLLFYCGISLKRFLTTRPRLNPFPSFAGEVEENCVKIHICLVFCFGDEFFQLQLFDTPSTLHAHKQHSVDTF